MAFLVQIRQSNKCGSVRNVEIINLHFGIWCGPLSQHPLPPARHQPHLMIPSAQTINQEKTKNPEMRSNFQQIVSYCLGLHIQNLGLREVLTRSTCRNKEETPKKNNSYRTAWTHIWIPALREVDLEPSAKRGTNRTRALVSLY